VKFCALRGRGLSIVDIFRTREDSLESDVRTFLQKLMLFLKIMVRLQDN